MTKGVQILQRYSKCFMAMNFFNQHHSSVEKDICCPTETKVSETFGETQLSSRS